MAKNKQRKPQHKSQQYNKVTKFTIVTEIFTDTPNKHLINSLNNINPNRVSHVNCVFISKQNNEKLQQACSSLPIACSFISINDFGTEHTTALAINEKAIFGDFNELTTDINLNTLFNSAQDCSTAEVNEVFFDDSKKAGLPHAIIVSGDKARYITSLQGIPSKYFYPYTCRILNSLTNNTKQLYAGQVVSKPVKTYRGKLQPLGFAYFWLIRTPLNELNNKPHKHFLFIKESSLFRLALTAMVVVTFFLLAALSSDAGNSGDEITLLRQAQKSYNFFATSGEDKSATISETKDPMHAYGQSFDLVTYTIAQWFNIDDIYKLRHLCNTILGWLTMVFTALIATMLFGWRAGLMAFLAILISPRFLGHSWNNPKDIPFAFGFTFTIYFIFAFIRRLPKISIRNLIFIALGLGFTNSIRIGGLLLIAYLFFFTGIRYLTLYGFPGILHKNRLNELFTLALYLLAASGIGYILGILLWPYALISPLKNPLEALDLMTNFSISLRQLFEGKIVWSDNLPWYYALKYMLITIPIYIFIGLATTLILIKKVIKNTRPDVMFLLFFWMAFPIFYTIYKDSNLYGGWRHLMFAYPPMVVLAVPGINQLYNNLKGSYFKLIITVLLLFSITRPLLHDIRNHPYQYVYYNEIIGGIPGAYGNYEMDYYFHSFKNASEWLIENRLKKEFNPEKKIIVKSNAGAKYFFKNYSNYVKAGYTKYYSRGNTDWDYMMVANSYISQAQLKQKIWPPSNTIHTINVDGYPICAILERKTKLDAEAYKSMQAGDYQTAVINYEQALKITPDNEAALINLAQIYQQTQQIGLAEKTLTKLLKIYPDNERALGMMGTVKLGQGKINEAARIFNKTIEENPKYGPAYYYMGYIYLYQSNDAHTCIKYLEHALTHTPNYKPAYLLMAEALKSLGQNQQAQRYLQAAQQLK